MALLPGHRSSLCGLRFQVTFMSISEGHQARTQQPEGGELAGLLRIMLS